MATYRLLSQILGLTQGQTPPALDTDATVQPPSEEEAQALLADQPAAPARRAGVAGALPIDGTQSFVIGLEGSGQTNGNTHSRTVQKPGTPYVPPERQYPEEQPIPERIRLAMPEFPDQPDYIDPSAIGLGRGLSEAGAMIAGVKPLSGMYDSFERAIGEKNKWNSEGYQGGLTRARTYLEAQKVLAQLGNKDAEKALARNDKILYQKSKDATTDAKELARNGGTVSETNTERQGQTSNVHMQVVDPTIQQARTAKAGRDAAKQEFQEYAPIEPDGHFKGDDKAAEKLRTGASQVLSFENNAKQLIKLRRAFGSYEKLPSSIKGKMRDWAMAMQDAIREMEGYGAPQDAEFRRLDMMVSTPEGAQAFFDDYLGDKGIGALEQKARRYRSKINDYAYNHGMKWLGAQPERSTLNRDSEGLSMDPTKRSAPTAASQPTPAPSATPASGSGPKALEAGQRAGYSKGENKTYILNADGSVARTEEGDTRGQYQR